jgi:hypothetical protein
MGWYRIEQFLAELWLRQCVGTNCLEVGKRPVAARFNRLQPTDKQTTPPKRGLTSVSPHLHRPGSVYRHLQGY